MLHTPFRIAFHVNPPHSPYRHNTNTDAYSLSPAELLAELYDIIRCLSYDNGIFQREIFFENTR
jgi:hypothetical protein